MKCPYCEEALRRVYGLGFIYHCDNVFCEETEGMGGTKELWQELTKTKQALDVAVNFIKGIYQTTINDCDNQYVVLGNFKKFAEKALAEIKQITETKE